MKKKIGVFANGWSGEFLKYAVTGIQNAAKKEGTDIFLFTTYILSADNTKNNMCQLNLFHLPKPEDFAGIIILTNSFNIPDEAERIKHLFVDKGVPALSLEIKIDGAAFMGTGNRKGMYDAVEHLITVHNCKKIIYCAGIKDNQENIIRKNAVVEALKDHNLELMAELPGDYGYYTTSEQVRLYLENGNELPDAFVCANDHMAMGTVATLNNHGYNVPGDVLVTGFDFLADGQATFPMLASVNRAWDRLGEKAYYKLMELIEKPDPTFEQYFDPVFIPSESCGCEPTEENKQLRLSTIRGAYTKRSESTLMDLYFSQLRISSTEVLNEEDFNDKIGWILEKGKYPNGDFYFCIEPDFFKIDEEEYPERIRGYSDRMYMIYGRENGESIEPRYFSKKDLLPVYNSADDKSDLYILIPMSYMKFIIGYIVLKNDTKMLFERTLRIWVTNMDTFFINLKRYIVAQQANKKLKEIYMTDFLTGMYNRMGCDKILYSFIDECKQNNKTSVLLFADIDRMKDINDIHGHLNGDLAIKATADALKACLPSNEWHFGRYGGDEFIVVGSMESIEGDASEFQTKLIKDVEAYIERQSLSFTLSVSIGYCVIKPDDTRNITDYVKIADNSMYEQKQKAHKRHDLI
ncbi:MAG: GGDEF domain-containing protein [Lachnospiraceae bacterium]|nr:GGDEF domain-containing protein [Lachnospiraceae bacterium]